MAGLLNDQESDWEPSYGLLGLASGLMQPTRGGSFGEALGNGAQGWASGAAMGRKLKQNDLANAAVMAKLDPRYKQQEILMEAMAKAEAAKRFPGASQLHGFSVGTRYIMADPNSGEEVKSWDVAPTPTSLASKGLTMTPQGVQAMPGYGAARGANKLAEEAPTIDFRNASEVEKENNLAPIKGNQAWNTQTGKDAADRFGTLQKDAQTAMGDLATYNRLAQILPDYEGGKLANARQVLGEIGNSMGLKLDPNLDDKQLFAAMTGGAALQRMKMMGGNDSNQDREFAQNIGPTLTQTAEGRRKVIGFLKAQAERQVQMGDMAQKWVNAYGRLDAPNQNGVTFQQRWHDYVNANPIISEIQ